MPNRARTIGLVRLLKSLGGLRKTPGRVPRQQQPDGIRVSYYRALQRVVLEPLFRSTEQIKEIIVRGLELRASEAKQDALDEDAFASASVLAGAYKGSDISERETLRHVVPYESLTVGRLKREAGEALCRRSLDLVDSGAWRNVSQATCPKCLEILQRITTEDEPERQTERKQPERLPTGLARDARDAVRRTGELFTESLKPSALEAVAEKFGKRTSAFQKEQLDRQVRSAVGVPFSAIERPARDLIPMFVDENVKLIKTVPARYFERMQRLVEEAYSTGMRPETLAEKLQELDDISDSDAMRIARDQIGKLNAQFNEERLKSIGVDKYIWRTAKDNRVRDEHAEREGEEFAWNAPPPDGHPGEAIQCRCYAEPVFNVDEG